MCNFCSSCSVFPTLSYGQSDGSFATACQICLNEMVLLLQEQHLLLLLRLCVTASVLLLLCAMTSTCFWLQTSEGLSPATAHGEAAHHLCEIILQRL